MLSEPVERCVRCGPPQLKKETFQEILDRGAKLRIDAPPKARPYASAIEVVDTNYKILVGYRGVLFWEPYKLGVRDTSSVLLVSVDLKTPVADKAYWGGIREEVFKLLPNHGNLASFLWKRVKAERMCAQYKSWRDVLPPDIVRWAQGVLDEVSKDDCCVDNYRVARVRNSSQRRRYRRQKEHGCCGFMDFVREGPDGHRYMLGFNYGH
jgi:hypothetical protein